MHYTDPKHREYLRDLPTGYLLDLLADEEAVDEEVGRQALLERGLSNEEIDERVARRRRSRWLKRSIFWSLARWSILGLSAAILVFNIFFLYRLLLHDDPVTIPLIFFTLLCCGFGFFFGYKMTSHIYQGGRHHLYCGFPVPVGYVDLRNGTEQPPDSAAQMIVRIAINAMVGVNLTVFPVMVIYLGIH
ncbi:MAG: hypothetical protein C0614_04630 [Desulfuromonas sp.]|nr:MAG: hypothetical protein C0614_04630 [Desulfuromonas sp.]